MAMASMAASDNASVVRLQRHTTSQAARYGLTSSRKPVTVTSRSTPSERARASTTPRVGPSPISNPLAGRPARRSRAMASMSWMWFFSGRSTAVIPIT